MANHILQTETRWFDRRSLAKGRVEAALVVGLGADGAEEQDPSSALAHVTGLDLGPVHQTVPAVPVPFWDGRQLGLHKHTHTNHQTHIHIIVRYRGEK